MKKILLICGIFSSGSLFGQEKQFDIHKYLDQKTLEEKNKIIFPPAIHLKSGVRSLDQSVWTLQNGNRIYALPQDNMPCVITDIRLFNMPNLSEGNDLAMILKPGNFPGKMPNAGHSKQLIPIK